ncbi:MAG: tetratricopeptide repeat protein [Acidobacteriota bacterium]
MARTTHRQKLLLLGVALVSVGLMLASVEGALALLGLGDDLRFVDPYVGFEASTPLFQLEDRVWATRPEKLTWFNHQEFPEIKGADTTRIFVLGGSTVFGRPYDDRVSFPRWLQRFLDAADPDRRHEVINAGGVSWASYRVARLMAELGRHRPDVYIVMTGHNEFLEERTYRDLRAEGPLRRWLRSRLARLRLARVVWGALDGSGGAGAEPEAPRPVEAGDRGTPSSNLPSEVRTRLDVWTGLDAFERDDALSGRVVEHFGATLRSMVGIAESQGADLVFVAPASNLADFSPFKSVPAADAADPAQARTLLAEGKALLAADDGAGALEALERAVALDPGYAESHFRLGRALLGLGRAAAAVAAFERARDLDVAPLRAVGPIAQQVARVAGDTGTPWVDLPSLLASASLERFGHGAVGDAFFLDHVHPNLEVHADLADRLLGVLAEGGHVRIGGAWGPDRKREIQEAVTASLDRDYYARRDVNLAKVLGWAGKLEEAEGPLLRAREVLPDDFELRLALGTLYQKTDRPEAALPELEGAAALGPDSAEAHFNLGVVYGRLGRLDEGLASLGRALELRPNYGEALHNRGILLARAGRPGEGVDALERARDLSPEIPQVHRALGSAYRASGRLGDAEASLRRALTLAGGNGGASPSDRGEQAATLAELAATLDLAGRGAEALDEVTRSLDLDPGLAQGHYVLGRLLAREGRSSDAAESYGRAFALDPGHARAANNLALLRASAGDLTGARDLLEGALRVDPSYAEAHLNLGVVFDRMGDPGSAVRALERAVELDPGAPRARLALALVYNALGRIDAARPHFDAARRGGLRIPPGVGHTGDPAKSPSDP